MRNKKISVKLMIVVVLLFVACVTGCNKEEGGTKISFDEIGSDVENQDYKEWVVEWHEQLLDAYFSDDIKKIESLVGRENKNRLIVTYRAADIKRGEEYCINIMENDDERVLFWMYYGDSFNCIGQLQKLEEGYVFKTADASQLENHKCGKCAGEGKFTITSGNGTTCGICGGSGFQYIPNLYYDAVIGWQGGNIGCGGCGGSGRIGGGSVITEICDDCKGMGYR